MPTTRLLEQADILITVCSHADTNYPLVATGEKKIHLPFFDPARTQGSEEEIDSGFDDLCFDIKQELETLTSNLIEQS